MDQIEFHYLDKMPELKLNMLLNLVKLLQLDYLT